ncbi:hypothetical protein BJV82DRAFT_575354 [Fennellomyces sp. T-0311]|nr:hypothetical protein BJV82DRAFT_575354 [Fennellomyces sp. T-0311]
MVVGVSAGISNVFIQHVIAIIGASATIVFIHWVTVIDIESWIIFIPRLLHTSVHFSWHFEYYLTISTYLMASCGSSNLSIIIDYKYNGPQVYVLACYVIDMTLIYQVNTCSTAIGIADFKLTMNESDFLEVPFASQYVERIGNVRSTGPNADKVQLP